MNLPVIVDESKVFQDEDECIDAVDRMSNEDIINWRLPSCERRDSNKEPNS